MNKVLVICGPTATGKTGLGLKLAKKLNGEILSADSRQVFRGMDIITGKDLPEDQKIWLLDLVEPAEEFSVARWYQAAQKVLQKVWAQAKLPILVGGTGLYIKAVVDGIKTIDIPPNEALRKQLAGKNVDELYDILAQLDSVRAAEMNRSDRRNPRRLVRAIEIALQNQKFNSKFRKSDILMVGLTAPRDVLYQKIDERVEKRLKEGALNEVERLLNKGVSWNAQAMQSLGYRQLRGYFEKKVSLQEATRAWKNAEHEYARKQLTWFKRDKRINWFEITSSGWQRNVEKLVKKWYSTN